MKDWATLLEAIATLLWPLFASFAAFLFRREIRQLLGRVRKGKLLGQEIELSDSLQALEAGALKAQAQLPALSRDADLEKADGAIELTKSILDESAKSPKAALIRLAPSLEKEVREILAVTGLHGGKFNLSARQMLQVLQERGMLPPSVSNTIDLFLKIRNQLVHGKAAPDDEVLRALDSGISLLNVLRAIPREQFIVQHPGLEVYADESGNKTVPGVKALLLEARGPGGVQKRLRAYPTTRDWYEKGQRVAWEWNENTVFDEGWYRDPADGVLREGWSQSMEFVGRPLEYSPPNPALQRL